MRLGDGTDWVQVVASTFRSYALRADGTIWAWGWNPEGMLGTSSQSGDLLLPHQVGSSDEWFVLAAGRSDALALKQDGTLWQWGQDDPDVHLVSASAGFGGDWLTVYVQAIDQTGEAVCAVSAGDLIREEAWGTWAMGGVPPNTESGGPIGIRMPNADEPDMLLPGHPIGLLLGKVGDWVFPAGSNTQVVSQGTRILRLLMNDRISCYGDNSGEITARVRVEPSD